MDDLTSTLGWPDAIYAQFRRVGIRQVGYVPDAGHSRLIELCVRDPDIHDVVLTTEEEGVALVAGAWLGGQRAALLMQSSGVGNCINMFSLLKNCGFPCLMLVTMRGEFGEFNPWQVPMGSITEESLEARRLPHLSRGQRGRRRRHRRRRRRHGVLRRSVGRDPALAAADRPQGVDQMMERRAFVQRRCSRDRGDLAVVCGLGSPTYDVAAAGDHPLNFYLWGAMGGAAMIGLGLALARPDRRVAVLTGDGEALMGLGSLATIGVKQPANLAIVVLDNQHYGETGMQPSHTMAGIDLVGVARACKFARGARRHRPRGGGRGARSPPSRQRARSWCRRGSRAATRRACCRPATATPSSCASPRRWRRA